jgi:hypothetical protein
VLQASPSLLYSPSGDPSFLSKDFSHKKSSRDFIENYSRGVPQTCQNYIWMDYSTKCFHVSIVFIYFLIGKDFHRHFHESSSL